MKIGLYGGSFDPFHRGHLEIIKAAWKTGKLDRLLVMPLGTAPHKTDRMSFAAYRYETVRLGLASQPYAELRDDEILATGKSYTLLTVRRLKKSLLKDNKKLTVRLIVGSDVLFSIDSWYKAEELLQEVRLFVALRGDEDRARAEGRARELSRKYGARVRFFAMTPQRASSTEIRALLKQGLSAAEWLPNPVARFVEGQKIYGFADDLARVSDECFQRLLELEKKIWKRMPQRRRVHTLNVLQYAVHLAVKHGLDPDQAALAGMVHDCAKYLPLRTQLKYAKRAGHLPSMNRDVAHGPAGSYYARTHLGVTDRDVLAAVFYHTTSRGLMTKLDQVLYLADKIEYGRPYKDLDAIRRAAEYDLDLAMEICLQEVYRALARDKKPVHPLTRAARLTLRHFQTNEKS